MEQPPAARPRGRPRKRRRKEEEEHEAEAKRQAMATRAVALVGRFVLKDFPGNGVFLGKVVFYECGLYRVSYEDGDSEDLDSAEVRAILMKDESFVKDLARRRAKLEKIVTENNAKAEAVKEKNRNKEESAVEVTESGVENNVEEKNDDDDEKEDDDSGSDSGLGESEPGVGVESLPPLPPPPELPASSGTVGVPEESVSHLFAVYGFLRSFSTRLFLMPFTLDEFVGAVNCRVPNTLFDAVHLSLMKVLRGNLEALSSEGSDIASKCLRCNDWSLLDSLTWPVFVIQYLVVSGHTTAHEWRGFYEEVSTDEYYLLSVSRKLMILQILCDNALDSEEIVTEMNIRRESEVGMDYDGEDILPSEVGLRRVQPSYVNTSACDDKEATKFVSASNAANQPGSSISFSRDTENTEDGDVDRNGDECRLCGMDGILLCCDGCPSAYHSRCIGVLKNHIPEGPWYCPECKINMTGPTITKGTSLRGSEIFGKDLYGQLFMGTCEHLLVLNIGSGEFGLRYYNTKDIPYVLQVLYGSMQHRPLYHDICRAVLQYWSVPESTLLLPPLGETPQSPPPQCPPSKSSLVNGQFCNYDHADDTRLPINLSLQTKESTQAAFEKCGHNVTNDLAYMGFSYKPLTYSNYYAHGDFAASAAAKFALLSSEESRSEGHVSDNQRKMASGNTYLQAKAFSLTASRFFWPSFEKKLVEVPRERCGWCFSCKAPVSSKRGCMLNHAALSATKSATKVLAGVSPIRSGEGILPSIATYIIYMEECLRGLVVGPFLSASYRRQWRKQVEQATTYSAIKPLLLKLEENIRTIAFCGDWIKLMDDWLVEFSMVQSATSTLGTAQKRAPNGRRYKKRSANDETTADGCPESFVWWCGGKFTKFIFQKAVLPKSMVRKAARQGGSRKILGIFYADSSEIPKRSRQLVWRVAVQMSRNASQLALQVRYLDFYLRWSDLIRPEQNIQDGKGQETEASVFRNANICDNKLMEGKICYGIAFGSQKHLPSRVMKNIVQIEQDPEGKDKYWFSETRIPLYLVKEYEQGNGNMPCNEEHLNTASELLHRRRLKAICKDIYFYLTCKRDNMDVVSCSVCQMGVLIQDAHKCYACQGYCHEGCSTRSTVPANEVEYLTTCKQCYHARLLAQKENNNESPTSPLLLQGRENNPGTFLKGSRPKSHDQVLKSSRTKVNNADMKQVTPVTALKGTKAQCYEQEPTSTRTMDNNHFDLPQVASEATLTGKQRPRKNSSWGIIWHKKINEDTDNNFWLRNILLKGGSNMPQLKPDCHLCRKPYMSDLMYICCEACQHWYHADAVELEESKICNVLGFKCCKCRRIKSPVCPYSDLKPKRQEGKKSRSRSTKKEHSGRADSNSGAISYYMRECEAATPVFSVEDDSTRVFPVEGDPTPVFPVEDDPLLFSLSSVELITEPKMEGDVEWNSVPGPGLRKLPVRRNVKQEGDDDVSFGDMPLHAEDFDNKLLNDPDNVNYDDYMEDFEPNTYFSLTELLQPEDGSQFEGVDVSGDLSGYLENSSTLIPEECGDDVKAEPAFSFQDTTGGDLSGYLENSSGTLIPEEIGDDVITEHAFSFQDTGYSCMKCSQMEPAPDLFCEVCGFFIHSECSPWVELPSRLGSWRCGNCRDW